MFVPTVNLLDEIRETVFYGRVGPILDALRDVECLAIDDLGMQKDSAWVGERLYELVNNRYNARKQLIVTTNARNLDDIREMVGTSGPQIESRLSQMTASFVIEAPDFRKRNSARDKLRRDVA
jgi:DNA replication protein DnaC